MAGRRIAIRLALGSLLVIAIAGAAFVVNWWHGEQVAFTRIAKAKADTRDIASAISAYAAHCGGLPIGDTTTNCATRLEPGGPFPVPGVLMRRQTNRAGQIAGPFIAELPKWWVAHDLAGQVGEGYAYFIRPGGKVLVCAAVAKWGQGGNSDGGATCP